jgi:hypothetical protein
VTNSATAVLIQVAGRGESMFLTQHELQERLSPCGHAFVSLSRNARVVPVII